MSPASRHDLAWVLVQLLLLGGVLLAPAWGHLPLPDFCRPLGYLIAGAGLLVAALATRQLHSSRSLTPLPSPRSGSLLLTSGCFRFVRHPIYSGLLLWALGVAVASASLLHLLLFALLGLFLNAKAAREESLLALKFSDYTRYAARTPRFFPSPPKPS
jgi:protein-S-isoprenylcysteine O-methyltransferase Ste14